MPWVLAAIGVAIAKIGWKPTPDIELTIASSLGTGLTVLLHLLETKFPWVGVFLGYLGAPSYAPSKKVTVNAQLSDARVEINELQRQVAAMTSASLPGALPPA